HRLGLRNRVHSTYARGDVRRWLRARHAGEPRSGPAGPLSRAHARDAGRGAVTLTPVKTATRRARKDGVRSNGSKPGRPVPDVRLTVDAAVRLIAAGKMLIVVDDEDRENEGDIVFAAQHATPALVNFAVKHCRGILCAPMAPEL